MVTRRRLAVAVLGAALLAASLGSAAEARIPEGSWKSTPIVLDDPGIVPDVFERAVARGRRTRPVSKASATGTATPDWLERAAQHAMRG